MFSLVRRYPFSFTKDGVWNAESNGRKIKKVIVFIFPKCKFILPRNIISILISNQTVMIQKSYCSVSGC